MQAERDAIERLRDRIVQFACQLLPFLQRCQCLRLRIKQELYRIAQEALHNTAKHARASEVVLRLEQTPDGITMEVCDDGVGFDTTASFPGHLGLHPMRERISALGGTFQIESTPGQGTTIRAHVPAGA